MNALERQRGCNIEVDNAAMRDRAAEDGGVQDAGRLVVVGELALAEQKAPVLRSLDGLPDERVRSLLARGNAHRPRSRVA